MRHRGSTDALLRLLVIRTLGRAHGGERVQPAGDTLELGEDDEAVHDEPTDAVRTTPERLRIRGAVDLADERVRLFPAALEELDLLNCPRGLNQP